MPLARCGGKFEMLGLLATAPLGLSFLAPTTHEDDAPAEWQRVRLKIESTKV